MKRLIGSLAIFFGLIVGPSATAVAVEIEYPQIIKTRYEAVDQKMGGKTIFVLRQYPVSHQWDGAEIEQFSTGLRHGAVSMDI